MMENLGGGLMLIFVLLGAFILMLWILLPFAVFGIKDKLDKQLELDRKILKELKQANGNPTEN